MRFGFKKEGQSIYITQSQARRVELHHDNYDIWIQWVKRMQQSCTRLFGLKKKAKHIQSQACRVELHHDNYNVWI